MISELEFQKLGCILTRSQFLHATGLREGDFDALRGAGLLRQWRARPGQRKAKYFKVDADKLRKGINLDKQEGTQ